MAHGGFFNDPAPIVLSIWTVITGSKSMSNFTIHQQTIMQINSINPIYNQLWL